jgi:hypothetical protein
MTARHDISRLAPSRADPFRSTSGGWRCRKGRAFPERDGDGALDRARAVNSTAASRTSEDAPPKVLSHGSRPMRRRKRRGNFPACKPLKYHKTGEIFWRGCGH